MACFYKRAYSASKNVYYPRAVVKGRAATLDDIGEVLVQKSCVSANDVAAVFKDFGKIISQFLSQGKSVKIDGLGSFRLTLTTTGVASLDQFDFASQVKSVRVAFTPEVKKSTSGAMTRAMVDGTSVEWLEWAETAETASGSDTQTGGETQTGGGQTGNQEVDPLS